MSDNNQAMLLPYLLLQGASLPEWQNRTDAELLTEYARQGSELAFAALVHRHGPMVWRICWHRLRHYQDAEDAFQATFLVLARRAADIRPPEMLANWLYGVARQTAHKASLMAARRRHKETPLTPQTDSTAAAVKPEEDWLDCLYEEMAHLPEKFRAVVVLCDLEGLSRKEAARQLGVPEGTIAGWLARARQLLHKRLARRGITLSLAAGLATLQANASAVPYRALLASVRVASLLSAGESLAAAVSVNVTVLAHAVMRSLSTGSLAVTLGGTIILSLAFVWWQGWNSFPIRQFATQDHKAYDSTASSDWEKSSTAELESPPVSVERALQDGRESSAQPDSPAIELSPKSKTKPAVARTATPISGQKLQSHKLKKPAQKKEEEDDDDDADDRFRDEDTYTVHGLVCELDAKQQILSITCWRKVTPHLKTFRLARGVRVWNRGRHDDLSVLQQGMWVQLEVCQDNHCVVRVKLKPKPKWLEERKT